MIEGNAPTGKEIVVVSFGNNNIAMILVLFVLLVIVLTAIG
ncbi:hypothetical protein [Brevibacillus choshinensis]|nr:hypothetical protein [Brevibacillus choshinensis]